MRMLLHVCTNLHVYKLEIDLCFSHVTPLSSGIALFSLELAIGEAGWLVSSGIHTLSAGIIRVCHHTCLLKADTERLNLHPNTCRARTIPIALCL